MVQTQASLPSWDGAKTLGDHGINYLIVFLGGSGPSNKRGDKTPHPGVDP